MNIGFWSLPSGALQIAPWEQSLILCLHRGWSEPGVAFENLTTNWGVPKMGVPQNGWCIGGNPIKFGDLGVPLFQKASNSKSASHQNRKLCTASSWFLTPTTVHQPLFSSPCQESATENGNELGTAETLRPCFFLPSLFDEVDPKDYSHYIPIRSQLESKRGRTKGKKRGTRKGNTI